MPLSPDLLSSSSNLYCPESAADVAAWDAPDPIEWAPPPDPLLPDRPISSLLAAESDHLPLPDYLSRFRSLSADSASRHDAVNWILKVTEFYRFRPVTAYLAVNYFDRFLSSHRLPGQNGDLSGWPLQLLSVASVSVAAKMEETHVPFLLDLQVLAPRFVFEPRTIRRMELLLMSALQWRMRSVTPFDFLDHFAALLPPELFAASRPVLFSRAADLILSTRRAVDFLEFRPSVLAAAAIICSAGEIADFSAQDYASLSSSFNEWVSEEMAGKCRQLMEEYLVDTRPSARRAKPSGQAPRSPVGVLDAAACASSDTQKSALPEPSRSAPETQAKRRRVAVGAGEFECTESIDTGDDDGERD